MRILLLRHGQTDWNLQGRCQGRTDLELNETGVQQARRIAEYLRREKIDAVYSSGLKRAMQTALAISQVHGLEVLVEPDLRELDHGEFEGLTFSDIKASYPKFVRTWRSNPADAPIPGGERLVDAESRTWKSMERIVLSRAPEETIVVVSHSFPIAAVLCRVAGSPLNEYRSFHVEPCGLRRLSYARENGWKILQVTDRGCEVIEEPAGPMLESPPAPKR